LIARTIVSQLLALDMQGMSAEVDAQLAQAVGA